jgi:hypothetical protein
MPQDVSQEAVCVAEGCTKTNIRALGLCRGHYGRYRKTGEIGGQLIKYTPREGVCLVPGCDKPNYSKQRCRSHYSSQRRKQMKMMLVASMGGVCFKCGGKYPPVCYDFHHLDPNTKDNHLDTVSVVLSRVTFKAFDEALSMASECALLCSNCHRQEHDNHKHTRVA